MLRKEFSNSISSHLFETLLRNHCLYNTLNRLCIVSHSSNPYINLALEEWLLRNSPSKLSMMLLYRNRPCIVIGRHQNPWYECRVDKLSDSLLLLRRHSGGGTVYHDMGNVNYVNYSSKEEFSRTATLTFLCKKLKEAFPNKLDSLIPSINHDLFIYNTFKVSGSAYRVTLNRAYHHGTMLIQSQLDELRSLLEPSFPKSWFDIGSSTISRPSKVANLSDYCAELTPDKFIDIISKDYEHNIFMTESDILSLDQLHSIISELESWDWIFGKTPIFQLTIDNTALSIDKGKLSNLETLNQTRFIKELNFKYQP